MGGEFLDDFARMGDDVVEEGVEQASKAALQFSDEAIDRATQYAMCAQNNIDLIFDAKHGLDLLVREFGGQEQTIRGVLNAANGLFPGTSVFDFMVNVSGKNVVLRGIIEDGMPKLGSMWIP